MRHLYSAIALTCAFSSATAQYAPPDPSGFQGIIVERYYESDANDAADLDGSTELVTGATTYRVFVDLKPGYKLNTVGGFTDHELTFGTTTSFFNNDDRGEAWGDNINDIHLDKNSVAIDSWLTVGAASDAHWGVLKSADTDGSIVGGSNNDGGSNSVPGGLLVNTTPGTGLPLTTADGLFLDTIAPPSVSFIGTAPTCFDPGGANSYSNDNFAMAVLGNVAGPDTANRILIGQFTTEGILTFCLNVVVRIPDSLVCPNSNCHELMYFYANLLPSDTAGSGFNTDNKFTDPTLCFSSAAQQLDCEGVPNGPAQPGTTCDDGNADTANDVYAADCTCIGEDCLGVLGGPDLPGAPCDDGDPNSVNDTWMPGCLCEGTVGINEENALAAAIKTYPNPTADMLWLEIERTTDGPASYVLRDALGHQIMDRDLGNLSSSWKGSLDLSDLSQGVYFLQVNVGAVSHTVRVTRF